MSSAKVTFKEQDLASIVAAMTGVYAGITIVSEKGPTVPTLITSVPQFIEVYGNPNPKLGVSQYSALNYLKQGNKLWVSRAVSPDTKYAAALVRSKIVPVPQGASDNFSDESVNIFPLKNGLTESELKAYQFPVYRTNRLFESLDYNVLEDVVNSRKLILPESSDIEVEDVIGFSNLALDVLNSDEKGGVNESTGENLPIYEVTSVEVKVLNYENLILGTPITVKKGDLIRRVVEGNPVDYTDSPTVVEDATNSTNILITSTDYIAHTDTVIIDNQITDVSNKLPFNRTVKEVTIDAEVDHTNSTKLVRVVQSEFEHRDAFLVVASTPGEVGKFTSIGITKNSNYDNAFNLVVYHRGVLVETWEVTRNNEIDGFQKQLQLETKINGKSKYIKVVNNELNINEDNTYPLPLETDYSLWRKLPEDIFVAKDLTITENLLKGHIEVKSTGDGNLILGDRIKFLIDDNTFSKEYKVNAYDVVNNTIHLDRKIEEDLIRAVWIDDNNQSVSTKIYFFNDQNNDPEEGIKDGIKYYPISKLPSVYPNNKLNSHLIISGETGVLLDSGINFLEGGSKGSPISIGHLITALKKLGNRETTPINLLMDGGFTYPAYAIALKELAIKQQMAHVYCSNDPSAEESADPVAATIAYKNSLNLNTHVASLFAGWLKVYDEYNLIDVWISPESFAAASQCFTTREYTAFVPAAGWMRSNIDALDIKVKFEEGDRDHLVANRINPIRYKEGSGYAIWGNETLLVKPSPMQLRSVSMLLIVIKTGFDSILQYKNFDLNSSRNWDIAQGSLNAFMRDEIKAKDGVYDYRLAIKEIITKSDLDNRRMPIFLGLQPTTDINEIPVTLGIFNNTIDIELPV